MTTHEVLKQYFGYDSFRPGQESLIHDILEGKNVLGIMPTGAGKSLCFQVPALMLPGITLVISPLISLMKDQVGALIQSGVRAAYINSSLTENQIYTALRYAKEGRYKIIYVAPERLLTDSFLDFARSVEISMLTVDEAHCISQWGQDFRPSYAKIPEFIHALGYPPKLSAFTATATPKVREDIVSILELRDPTVLVTGFDRENLYFEVQKPRDKFAALLSFLADKEDISGIVYCSTRANVEEVCDRLNQKGYNASRYHAGLPDRERQRNQDDFLYDRVRIMVATNAFGMGIDKSNVSFVVHYNMPKDMESYYQEAGRAGRDGGKADCLLLYSGQDVRTNLWLIENARDKEYETPELDTELKERDRKRLRDMTFYCATNDCLRWYILRYFGEHPIQYCGNCGNCSTNFETVDITEEARQILLCVAGLNGRFGLTMLTDILRGSKNERLLRLGLDRTPAYGKCQKTDHQLRSIADFLILNGYLIKTDDEYPVIRLGERVLEQGEALTMKLAKEREPAQKTGKKQSKTPGVAPEDQALFARLRELRGEIAKKQSVPAYVIFPDSTLVDMCAKKPSDESELLTVSGVGEKKLERFGKQFLAVLAEQEE